MTPRPTGASAYLSKYWPSLNGVAADGNGFASWESAMDPQSERENILLDIIGAYDLLLLQGLTEQGVSTRLGLRKSRDELVQELDTETARRLAVPIPGAAG